MSGFLNRFRFPIAVGLTSIALVVAIGVAGLLTVPRALAFGPAGGPPWASHAFGAMAFELPAELQGLQELSPAERFKHFIGLQATLTDRDNNPVTVTLVPGTVTAASPTSLTLAANDGSTKTFALDAQTLLRGKWQRNGAPNASSAPVAGDAAVVVTLNNSATAKAVIAGNPDSFGPRGPWGRR